MSRALTTYFAGQKDQALAGFDKARHDSGKGDSVEWQVAGARLLDLARIPRRRRRGSRWANARPDELGIQEAALQANSPRSERDFVDRTIERVKKLTGGEGVQWRVAARGGRSTARPATRRPRCARPARTRPCS